MVLDMSNSLRIPPDKLKERGYYYARLKGMSKGYDVVEVIGDYAFMPGKAGRTSVRSFSWFIPLGTEPRGATNVP